MFDYIDKHKRLAQVVLSVITMTFVFFGTYSYFQRSTGVPEVANVGGDKITQQEYDDMLRDQQAQMRERLGKNYDPAMFDSPEVRFAMVEQLINQKLLEREARDDHFRVTDQQLQQFIAALPPFQVDGKFSPDRYKLVLSAQQMSPRGVRAEAAQRPDARAAAGADRGGQHRRRHRRRGAISRCWSRSAKWRSRPSTPSRSSRTCTSTMPRSRTTTTRTRPRCRRPSRRRSSTSCCRPMR